MLLSEDIQGWFDQQETPLSLNGATPQIVARADSQRVYLSVEHLQDVLTGPVRFSWFGRLPTSSWPILSNADPVREFYWERHGPLVQRELQVALPGGASGVVDIVITEIFLRRVPRKLFAAYQRANGRIKR